MKTSFIKYLSVFLIVFFFSNCAKRGRPTGGKKDTTPPTILNAKPRNNTTHFKSDKIKILFNEYIKIKDINTQLIISPPLKTKPIIYPQGTASKFISIKILDTLLQNTTYTFNFGNSIVDNNQENPYKQFMYVFSTGDYLDSLSVKGTVTSSLKQQADKNILLMLYDKEGYYDSIIYKEKPKYITNTLDSIGFKISNIKAGNYKLIALKDKNHNTLYEPKSDEIGFVTDFIAVSNDSIAYSIALFKEVFPFKLLRPLEEKKGKIIFPFEGNPKNFTVKLKTETPSDFRSIKAFEREKDTLNYWFTSIKKDSLVFEVFDGKKTENITVKLRSKIKDSLKITSLSKNILHYIKDTFMIASSLPLLNIDASKISIVDKDSLTVAFKTAISKDKTRLKLLFNKTQNQVYNIKLLPNAIKDIYHNTNDTLTYNAKTLNIENYGNLEITLKNIKKHPIIVELLSKKGALLESTYLTKKNIVNFNLLEPKTYVVRLIYDTNKDKKWSTGNYLQKLQAEQVVYFSKDIEIMANWDFKEVFDLK